MANPIEPRVVHLIASSGFYGAERVVANLCEAMDGIDDSVLCLANDVNSIRGFEQCVANSNKTFHITQNTIASAFRKLAAIKARCDNFVIHAHGYKEIVIACWFQKNIGARVIVTQHGFTERKVKSRIYNWIDMAFCRWADIEQVLCVSSIIYDRYRKFGVDEARLTLLPNGVPRPKNVNKQRAKKHIAEKLGIDKSTPIVIYAGRLSEEKDPLLFVSSIREMAKKTSDFVAVIAGQGPLEESTNKAISESGLNSQIKCLGFVENVDELLQAADVLLVTSKTEGTPMIVLEAMMRSCTVVSTRVGGMPEIIPNDSLGFLVDGRVPKNVAERCLKLLKNPDICTEISNAAVQWVNDRYSLDSQLDGYRYRYNENLK